MQILICGVQKWELNRSWTTFFNDNNKEVGLISVRVVASVYNLSVTPGFFFCRYPAAFKHFSKSTGRVGRVKSFWSKEIIKNLTLTLY